MRTTHRSSAFVPPMNNGGYLIAIDGRVYSSVNHTIRVHTTSFVRTAHLSLDSNAALLTAMQALDFALARDFRSADVIDAARLLILDNVMSCYESSVDLDDEEADTHSAKWEGN